VKTYKNLLGEIQRLQTLAAKRRRKEVGAVIADIRQKTAKPKRKSAKRKVAPKYKDPQSGATWSGRGLTPRWLAEKEKAGAKREEFLIKRK